MLLTLPLCWSRPIYLHAHDFMAAASQYEAIQKHIKPLLSVHENMKSVVKQPVKVAPGRLDGGRLANTLSVPTIVQPHECFLVQVAYGIMKSLKIHALDAGWMRFYWMRFYWMRY